MSHGGGREGGREGGHTWAGFGLFFFLFGKAQFGQEISRGIFPIGHKRNAIFARSGRLIEELKYKNILIFSLDWICQTRLNVSAY